MQILLLGSREKFLPLEGGFASGGRLRKLNVGTLSANTEGPMLLPSVFALDNSASYWVPSVSPPPCEFESRFLILSLSSPPTNRLFLLSETCFSLPSHFSIFICQFLPFYFHLPHQGFFCSHIFLAFPLPCHCITFILSTIWECVRLTFPDPCPPAPAQGWVWWKGHESAHFCL